MSEPSGHRRKALREPRGLTPMQLFLVLAGIAIFAILIANGLIGPSGGNTPPGNIYPR